MPLVLDKPSTSQAISPHGIISNSAAVAFQKMCQSDPFFFYREVLGCPPAWDKQNEISESVSKNKFTLIHSGYKTGKTRELGKLALWYLSSFAPCKIITTASTWDQVETQLWQEIHFLYNNSRVPLGGTLNTTSLKMGESWFAKGLSTKNEQTFQGNNAPYVLIIVDEAPSIDERILSFILGLPFTKIVLCGNPHEAQGIFYQQSQNPKWNTIHIDCLESPNVSEGREVIPGLVTKDWCDERKEEWGEDNPLYITKVRGMFAQKSDDYLFPLSSLEACQSLEMEEGNNYSLGVDPADSGPDETVFSLMKGPVQVKIDHFVGIDSMEIAGRIVEYKNRLGNELPDRQIGIDDTGASTGKAIVSRLKELGVYVTPVNFSEKAKDSEHYLNKRQEMFFLLASEIKEKKIKILPDNRQAAQLAAIKTKMTSRGRIVEPKEETKKRLKHSPDRADALAIANYVRTPGVGDLITIIEVNSEEEN